MPLLRGNISLTSESSLCPSQSVGHPPPRAITVLISITVKALLELPINESQMNLPWHLGQYTCRYILDSVLFS